METERPAQRFAVVLSAAAVLLLSAATLLASHSGGAGHTILGSLAAPIEGVIAAGAALAGAAGAWLHAIRYPAAALGILALAGVYLLPRERRGPPALLAALWLGWCAQVFLLAGSAGVGGALYAGVVAAALAIPRPTPAPAPLAGELPVLALLLGLFTLVCLYRLDVHPNLYVDEMAYLRAARMFGGQLPPGKILGSGVFSVYVYDQFLAQMLPLSLQAAAVSVLPSDVIATRLASLVAVAGALVVAVLALRGPLGGRVTAWMLALAAVAPLVVVYARTGFYIAFSMAYSAVGFAALLWLWRRWDVRAGAVVGLLLGASLYQYQLSWFVPVFAGLAFALSPELWRRPGVARVVATTAVAAAVVALPGFALLETGLGAVAAQTFDRAVWNVPGVDVPAVLHEPITGALAIAPAATPRDRMDAVAAAARARGLWARLESSAQGESLLWFGGSRTAVRALTAELDGRGFALLDFEWLAKNPGVRLRTMLSELFHAMSWESSGRWVGVPLLNPLLAPLLVIGGVLAWRRRAEPALRLLLVWVAAGALLPAIAGGPAPRRTSLMLPFAYALMALPIVVLGGFRPHRAGARAAGAVLALAFFAVAACTGCFLYFREWNHQQGPPGGGGQLLDFVQILKTLPVDEPVLMPKLFVGLDGYLDAGDASRRWPPRTLRALAGRPGRIALQLSCAQRPPFTWLVRNSPDQRAALAAVAKHFDGEVTLANGVLVMRVTAASDGFCGRRSVPE